MPRVDTSECCPGNPECKCCDGSRLQYVYSKDGYKSNCCNQELFQCADRVLYHSQTTPDLECRTNTQDLNVQLGVKPDLNFAKTCNDNCWVDQYDGRLNQLQRQTVLDRPPMTGRVNDKYSNGLRGYKTGYYNDYSQINTGEIQYYNDNTIGGPFIRPNFSLSAQTDYFAYKDPMGNISHEFERKPLTCNQDYMNCNQWMKDSTSHREDILASQIEKYNETSWSAINGHRFAQPVSHKNGYSTKWYG